MVAVPAFVGFLFLRLVGIEAVAVAVGRQTGAHGAHRFAEVGVDAKTGWIDVPNPFTPGLRQQMPRTIKSIFTPASEAR